MYPFLQRPNKKAVTLARVYYLIHPVYCPSISTTRRQKLTMRRLLTLNSSSTLMYIYRLLALRIMTYIINHNNKNDSSNSTLNNNNRRIIWMYRPLESVTDSVLLFVIRIGSVLDGVNVSQPTLYLSIRNTHNARRVRMIIMSYYR